MFRKYNSIVIFLVFFGFLQVKSQNAECWPSFRGDNKLTGYTDVILPDNPELLWIFETEDAIKSSPVVCDGKIFIGSDDGNIYFNAVAFKMKEPKEWASHIIKQSFNKEELAAMSEEEKKNLPIFGNLKSYDGPKAENNAISEKTFEDMDDLPF